MYKKICILLLAFMLTACSNASTSDSQAETEAVSETTTTTFTTTDDSEQPTTTTTQITVTSAKEKESETTTSKVTSGSQSTTADSTMSTTTTTTKASQTTTGSSKTPASSVQKQQPKPAKTTTITTTTKAAPKTQPQNNVVWLSSMKVWRKLCEGKNLTASEQEMIRSEIASYAAKFQGKTQIHVSFGNDSFDISYPKPIQMTRKKDMVDWTTNAHFDASVDMDCRAIINYAKSEKQIYDVVAQTRNDALHIIDHGLHSRYEISKLNNCLEYANVIQYNIGFDGTYLWFLTQD